MSTALRLTCAALVATFVALGTTGIVEAAGPSADGGPSIGVPRDTWGWE